MVIKSKGNKSVFRFCNNLRFLVVIVASLVIINLFGHRRYFNVKTFTDFSNVKYIISNYAETIVNYYENEHHKSTEEEILRKQTEGQSYDSKLKEIEDKQKERLIYTTITYRNIQYAIFEDDKLIMTNSKESIESENDLQNIFKNSQLNFIAYGNKGEDLIKVNGSDGSDYFKGYANFYGAVKKYKIKLAVWIPKNMYFSDGINLEYTQFKEAKRRIYTECIIIVICALLFILTSLYIYKFKKIFEDNEESKGIFYRIYRNVWLEVKIILSWIFLLIILENTVANMDLAYYFSVWGIKEIIILIVGTYIIWQSYNSIIIRGCKKGFKTIFQETSLLYKIFNNLQNGFINSSEKFKAIVYTAASAIFLFMLIIGNLAEYRYNFLFRRIILGYSALYIVVFGWLGLRILLGINQISKGANIIAEGNGDYKIEKQKIELLDELAQNITNMGIGLESEIKNRVKSERMKTELITNVSHDLKTPLTSIINYVDLMQKENISKEEMDGYIKILDRKSQRLKVLIEDLFEASSAASGEIELNMERLDIVALLKQSLAEFHEKIRSSKLDFKTTLSNNKIYVNVDGKRTWRIFENQISNILKYSMDNTRVYINIEESEESVSIIMKNISAYELDFNEDEITDRFKRGDKARNTEGSGLGLAISKGLTELQGGSLKVSVDGDLFKVEIKFKKCS